MNDRYPPRPGEMGPSETHHHSPEQIKELIAKMTDMRATERLLEVIQEMAHEIRSGFNWDNLPPAIATGFGEPLARIEEATAELRRRGDTLVRRDDIRDLLAFSYEDAPVGTVYPADSVSRLEEAISR